MQTLRITTTRCKRPLSTHHCTKHRQHSATPSSPDAAHKPGSTITSSPHPISHIHLLKIIPPANESLDERNGRRDRENVMRFHHEFWMHNNLHFGACKQQFEEQVMSQTEATPTPSDWSRFYRAYLESTYDRHADYNAKVWMYAFASLRPAFLAEWARRRRMSADLMSQWLDARKENVQDVPWLRGPPPPSWKRTFNRAFNHLGYGYRAVGITVR
ncbi:hypothetical protein SeLEV6574_g04640 [Synchytrium endobioticum]|uniref:Uncharacterized protein n=1 Tax=Synchytrium endobioticum TaxID=286115 RepID=A0A507CYP5_9FUNG|nr:hypothetical protein SeLEV6574_g04640 [Synchytrium endobioticum]